MLTNPTEHELEILWKQCCQELENNLPESAWNTWFHGLHYKNLKAGILTITAPNKFCVEKINSDYKQTLENCFTKFIPSFKKYDIEVIKDQSPQKPKEAKKNQQQLDMTSMLDANEANGAAQHSFLNNAYTFENFVIGSNNRFAHAASLAVAEQPSKSYNPLFVYGSSGLGKTHLLHAIGNHIRKVFPNKQIVYVAAETFMNDFVDAIRTNNTKEFKKHYRDVDVLMIDDIQFLERSQQLQEEFFHTFNSLHEAKKQIILSCDRPPKALSTLEDRLRSRFEWGLITDVHPPELETRLAILKLKIELENLTGISSEVLEYIASQIKNNVRELEGALIRVAAFSSLNREPLTLELTKKVLKDSIDNSSEEIVPENVIELTAKKFGFSTHDLLSSSRRRPLVYARQVGMYVLRECTELSLPKIAELFGGKDHTTVLHSIEKIKNLITEKTQAYEDVTSLISEVKSS